MDCHPNNTVAKYTTKLPTMIELDGDYEVGLAEITYPRSYYNIDVGECWIEIWRHDGDLMRSFVLNEGYYATITDVIDRFNSIFEEQYYSFIDHGEPVVTLKPHANGKYVIFEIPKGLIMHMSPNLAHVMGFIKTEYIGPKIARSERNPDLVRGFLSMYVYCDIVEPVIVGDSKVPLLRTVNLGMEHTEIAYRSYMMPLYMPVQKKHFDTIEINIMTDTGVSVPFTPGKAVVVLHFRRTQNSFFLFGK